MDLTKPRVVIIGGGFAGVAAARALARAEANVVLIDKHNTTSFSPFSIRSQPRLCILGPLPPRFEASSLSRPIVAC